MTADAALEALNAGRLAEAEALLRDLVSRSPAQAETLARLIYNRAVDAFTRHGAAAAEPLLREAFAVAPALPEIRRSLAEMAFRRAWESQGAAAAQAAWEAAVLWPGLDADLGAPVAALAHRLHDAAIACAATDPLLACRPVLAAWGLCRHGGTNYATARSLFVHLGTGELGKEITAEEFEALLAQDAGDLVALIGLSNLHRRARRLNQAESLCRRALAQWPDNPFAMGRLASILAEQGRSRSADALFLELGRQYGGVEAAIRLSPDFIAPLRADPPPVAPGPKHADLVVMAGCDAGYFHRFSDALANSLAKTCPRVLLHFHVIGADDEVLARLAQLRERLPGLPIRLSSEPLPDLPPDQLRTYFACARFLRLPDLLAEYQRPVLMLDVDMVVLRNVAPLAEQVRQENADLALVQGEHRDPWCRLWADIILAAPTPRTMDYLSMVRNYIIHFTQAGQAAWFLDQIALFAVQTAGFDDRAAPKMLQWPTDIQNSSTDHAYFWSLHVSQPSNVWADQSDFYLSVKA
ncbi:MAG: hypothetical protein H7Y60_04445 [Rhodospirillaceae bacterium]|nr:hypothetical protein [Rhodospirillales bacterium]